MTQQTRWTASVIVFDETQATATADSPEDAVRELLKQLLQTGEMTGHDIVEFGQFITELEENESDPENSVSKSLGDFADNATLEVTPAHVP